MFRPDQLPPIKLIISGKEYVTGEASNIRLESIKPAPGGTSVLIGLEVTKDPVLYQKIVNAAEQRSIKVQVNKKEFSTELATQMSSQEPVFKGRVILRQISKLQNIITR